MKSVVVGILATTMTLLGSSYNESSNKVLSQEAILKTLNSKVEENTKTMKELKNSLVDLKLIIVKLDTVIAIKIRGIDGRNNN